jgi:hypothetical protein
MSEKRETILRLLQDETGRILDVKVEQQPVPVPEYVFDASNYYTKGDRSDGDGRLLVSGSIKSYKTVGDDETIIPVPCSVNGKPVTIGASGEGSFEVLFDTATMEPDPEHPTVYDVVVRFVQEESGETFALPYTIKVGTYLRISPKPVRMSYEGGEEQTIDIVLKNAFYKDLIVRYDSKETSEWLHASVVGKQLRITCDKNFKVKERSGVVTLSLSSDDKANASVMITQEAEEVKCMIRSSCTDAHLSDDKSRRFARVRLTVLMADQHTGKIIDPDVPWTVTGSDERVVVESVDEAKRELLLSTDAADTLETPVTVTLHLEDGSDMSLPLNLDKYDLTPSEK